MTPHDEIRDEQVDFGDLRTSSLRQRAAPPPRRVPEAEIVADVISYLRTLGWARKTHGSAEAGSAEPDVDACVRGRAIKIEGKRPGERPTSAQMAALRRWAGTGALAAWFTERRHVVDLLDHVDDVTFMVDLDHPGCACPVHRGRS